MVVDVPWSTLVLVCSACRGARHGPDPGVVRKALKKRLGKPKSLRVLEVDCLKLCPDDAVAVFVSDHVKKHAQALLIGSEHDLDQLVDNLRRDHPG